MDRSRRKGRVGLPGGGGAAAADSAARRVEDRNEDNFVWESFFFVSCVRHKCILIVASKFLFYRATVE